ncbi:hypothetical protein Hanom_Chr08g00708101 [Helianthus anomalus]
MKQRENRQKSKSIMGKVTFLPSWKTPRCILADFPGEKIAPSYKPSLLRHTNNNNKCFGFSTIFWLQQQDWKGQDININICINILASTRRQNFENNKQGPQL